MGKYMGGAAFEILGVQKTPKDIETGGAGFTEVDMGRRRALAKLGLSFVAVYTAPFLLRIHHAAADGNGGGDGSGGSGHDDDHGPSGSGPSGHAASGAADEGAVTAASSEATTVSLSESAAPAATSAPSVTSTPSTPSVTSTPSTPSVPTTPAVPTVPVAGSGEGGDDTLWFLAEVRQALLGLMSAYYVAGLGDGAGGPEQVQIVAELAAKLVSYKP